MNNGNWFTDTKRNVAMNSGILQGSRLGFKGTEDLGGGLSAVFNLEAGFKNDTGALDENGVLFRRKSVVGLSGGFGTVLLGRQTDVLDDIGGTLTSVADFGGVTGAVGHNLDRLEGTRSNNSIRYNTANLGGFVGTLMYGLGEQAGKNSAGQSFGVGGLYTNGPLGLGAGYYQSKAGATPSDASLVSSIGPDGEDGATVLKTFTLAASYQLGAARLYGNWSRVKQPTAAAVDGDTVLATYNSNGTWSPKVFTVGGSNNDKTDIFELGTAYALNPSLKLLGSVQQSRINYVDAAKGKLTQINLGADYWLSKRTDLYAFVSNLRANDGQLFNPGISNNTASDQTSQTAVSVGIRHKF
ncbi:MAG TPA: porin, partial [Herbaspirillum sp.]|nr:porin [Herbaspirillum sp.]